MEFNPLVFTFLSFLSCRFSRVTSNMNTSVKGTDIFMLKIEMQGRTDTLFYPLCLEVLMNNYRNREWWLMGIFSTYYCTISGPRVSNNLSKDVFTVQILYLSLYAQGMHNCHLYNCQHGFSLLLMNLNICNVHAFLSKGSAWFILSVKPFYCRLIHNLQNKCLVNRSDYLTVSFQKCYC